MRFLYLEICEYQEVFKNDFSVKDLKKYFPKLERAKCRKLKATENVDYYFTSNVEEPLCDYFVSNDIQ